MTTDEGGDASMVLGTEEYGCLAVLISRLKEQLHNVAFDVVRSMNRHETMTAAEIGRRINECPADDLLPEDAVEDLRDAVDRLIYRAVDMAAENRRLLSPAKNLTEFMAKRAGQ